MKPAELNIVAHGEGEFGVGVVKGGWRGDGVENLWRVCDPVPESLTVKEVVASLQPMDAHN